MVGMRCQSRVMHRDELGALARPLGHGHGVGVGALDAQAAIQYSRLDAKPFADLFGQRLRLPGLHRNHVAADLFLQFARCAQGHQLAAIQNRQAVAPICFLHQVCRQQNGHAVFIAQALEIIRQFAPDAGIESRAGLVQ